MRRRIPKQKSPGRLASRAEGAGIRRSPLLTMRLLCLKTESQLAARQFERMRVERLVGEGGGCRHRGARQKLEYSELIHDYPVDGLMSEYYPWEQIRQRFTLLVTSQAIRHSVVMVDFKKDHYRMTTRYQRQVRALRGVTPKKMESTMSIVSLREERQALAFEGVEGEAQGRIYELLVGSIAPMIEKTFLARKSSPLKSGHRSPPNTPIYPSNPSEEYGIHPKVKQLALATSRPGRSFLAPRSPPSRQETEYDSTRIPRVRSKQGVTSRGKLRSHRSPH